MATWPSVRPRKLERQPVTRRPYARKTIRQALLLLTADVGHVRDARDLAILVHADVLVFDVPPSLRQSRRGCKAIVGARDAV